MNKLKLDLDALAVESFEPAVAPSQTRGTVRARGAETVAPECYGVQGETDYCTSNCTYAPCTGDDQCLAATLPPKCL